jgi:excisionase family DNA binding protein
VETQTLAKAAYSIAEAVCVTGCGRSKLYEEIRDGRLRAIKLGARTLIPAEAISAWLASLPAVSPAAIERRDGALS